MTFLANFTTLLCNFFHSIPETFVNISQQAIVSYLCLNLAITPVFIACQTQLMLSVFAVLFFFINTALILIILGLEYLGLAILLVYAGAIIMILLFVIMLVKLQETENQPFSALAPSRWSSFVLPFQTKHVQFRSLFLIVIITLGASLLTYSCKSLVLEIMPFTATDKALLNLRDTFGFSLHQERIASNLSFTQEIHLPNQINTVPFNPMYNPAEANYIPWLLNYFNNLLEMKFQPLVLEVEDKGSWSRLAIHDAPSYNLDRWTLDLVGQLGKLQELLPAYHWAKGSIVLSNIPATGDPVENVAKLINYASTEKHWEFYPRTRLGVFGFPNLPVRLLQANNDIPLIYAQECEFKDQLVFPQKDITNISSVLYTLHAPSLVLAAVCLFVAMVLSFLLTDFKIKY